MHVACLDADVPAALRVARTAPKRRRRRGSPPHCRPRAARVRPAARARASVGAAAGAACAGRAGHPAGRAPRRRPRWATCRRRRRCALRCWRRAWRAQSRRGGACAARRGRPSARRAAGPPSRGTCVFAVRSGLRRSAWRGGSSGVRCQVFRARRVHAGSHAGRRPRACGACRPGNSGRWLSDCMLARRQVLIAKPGA